MDESGRADLAQARQQRFEALPGDVNLGFRPGVVWLRMQVQGGTGAPADWWLEVAPGFLDELTLWVEPQQRLDGALAPAAEPAA
ncbi:MAG: hypothetical protein K2W93_05655, partial [Burkholderiaceae bacterium]|nr:hypothetical protein [Burkholderiaceae bacterium]